MEPAAVVESSDPVESTEVVEGQQNEAAKEVEAEPVTGKAPQSWGVEAREDWGKLPPEFQDQIAKR